MRTASKPQTSIPQAVKEPKKPAARETPTLAEWRRQGMPALEYASFVPPEGLDEQQRENLFACRANGLCLYPQIHDGDVLQISPDTPPEDGDIVMAEVDGKILIKRYRQENGETWLEYNKPSLREERKVRLQCSQFSIVGVALSYNRSLRGPIKIPVLIEGEPY